MRSVLAILATTAVCFAAGAQLGQPLTLKTQVAINDLAAKPAEYVGKTVQVHGKVTEVCEMMGCWTVIVDPNTQAKIKIKVKDGDIVFPKDSVGKTVTAEGKLMKLELTKEQAIARMKHEAEEQNRKFDPASVKGPMTIYQIAGTGAVID